LFYYQLKQYSFIKKTKNDLVIKYYFNL